MKMKLKGNKGAANSIVVMLVIFILMLICLIVCLLKNPNLIIQISKSNKTSEAPEIVEETKTEVVTKEMTADEKYAEYVKNLKAEMLKYNEEKVEGKEYREYFIDGKDENDKKYSVSLSGDGKLVLNEKEVATNVVGFNVVNVGNGGYSNLYFIKDDGTVGTTSIEEVEYLNNGKVKTREIEKLKNIVSIIPGMSAESGYPGACYAYAIDINGNMFEI